MSWAWKYFKTVDAAENGPRQVQCLLCPFRCWPHAKRMAQHLSGQHTGLEGAKGDDDVQELPSSQVGQTIFDTALSLSLQGSSVGSQDSSPLKRPAASPIKRQPSMVLNLDRRFTSAEQEKAQRLQCMAGLMNGWSYNCHESSAVRAFLLTLRPDYQLPSRKVLMRLEKELFETVETAVNQHLLKCGIVTLAWDSWTNPSHMPTLAFLACHPQETSVLLSVLQLETRETIAELIPLLKAVQERLRLLNVKCLASVQDNGANVKKASQAVFPISINCMAHTIQLLLKDISTVWTRTLEWAAQTQQFFANRHRPCQIYADVKRELEESRKADPLSGIPGPTNLVAPAETRWASQVDCIESLCRNRQLVMRCIERLRQEEFEFKGHELIWVHDDSWWGLLQEMLKVFIRLRCMIDKVQASHCDLASGVETVLKNCEEIVGQLVNLAPGDKAFIVGAWLKRKEMLLTDWGILANILHPAYRGRRATPEVSPAG